MKISKKKHETVEAGAIFDALKKGFSSLLKGGLKLADNLIKLGIEFSEVDKKSQEQLKENETAYIMTTGNDLKIPFKVIDNGDQGWEVHVKTPSGRLEAKSGLPKTMEAVTKYLDDLCEKYFEEWGGREDTSQETKGASDKTAADESKEATASIKVGLRKVQSANSIDVQLVNIECSIDPQSANNMIADVLQSPEFMEMLSEQPSYFSIVDDNNDELLVEPCCSIDLSCCYDNLIRNALDTYNTVRSVYFNACGPNMLNLKNVIESPLWGLKSMLDRLAEKQCMEIGYSKPIASYLDACQCIDTTQGFGFNEGLEICRSKISQFVDVLKLQECNLCSDDQLEIKSWIRDLENFSNYQAPRMANC